MTRGALPRIAIVVSPEKKRKLSELIPFGSANTIYNRLLDDFIAECEKNRKETLSHFMFDAPEDTKDEPK